MKPRCYWRCPTTIASAAAVDAAGNAAVTATTANPATAPRFIYCAAYGTESLFSLVDETVDDTKVVLL